MKNKNLYLYSVLGIAMLLTACGTSSGKRMPLINKHIIKTVPCYTLDATSMEPGFAPIEGYKSTLHFFNNNDVPYMSVVNFFKDYVDMSSELPQLCSYSYRAFDHKVEITSVEQRATATIDFDNQCIIYSNYAGFLLGSPAPEFSTNTELSGGEKYFVGTNEHDIYQPNEFKINLRNYHIPAYFEAGEGYLPLYLYRNLFQLNSIASIYYNGNGLYILPGFGDSEYMVDLLKIIREEGNQNFITSKDVLNFNYDLLACTFDNVFGMKERKSRIDGRNIKYFEKGAYKTLAPYKERLMSTEPNVSNDAMYEIFDVLANDGGHSGYGTLNIFSDKESGHERVGEVRHTFDVLETLTEARETAGVAPSQVITSEDPYATIEAYYKEIDNVAFVCFDSFSAPTENLDPANINETNYYNDTISLIHYANEQIKKHNIKNVVLDLSCNTGGVVFTCLFASSWISNGSLTYRTGNAIDHSFIESTVHADVNLDGKFDANDYLSNDVQVYCITSNASFSCGNLMPTLLEDNSNTKFIGQNTGGGCCNVVGNYYTAIGGSMRLSVMLTALRKGSTKDNFITNESGLNNIDFPISVDSEHKKDFYDHEGIIEIIKNDK